MTLQEIYTLEDGSAILKNVVSAEAPSIEAASSSSFGKLLKKLNLVKLYLNLFIIQKLLIKNILLISQLVKIKMLNLLLKIVDIQIYMKNFYLELNKKI